MKEDKPRHYDEISKILTRRKYNCDIWYKVMVSKTWKNDEKSRNRRDEPHSMDAWLKCVR